MTNEEYDWEMREKAGEEWGRLMSMLEQGRHPPKDELAAAVAEYGLERASNAALYVAWLLAGGKRPRGNPGPRRSRLNPELLRWHYYYVELGPLQVLRKADPRAYRTQHGAASPSAVALKRTAAHFGVPASEHRVLKLIRSARWPSLPPKRVSPK